MGFFTADLCDNFSDKTEVLGPDFQSYGGNKKFKGEIVTIKLDKNNKDAKINKYVAAATTLNLAVAYAWLKDFNKAYDFLEDHKALDENYDNTYNADLKFIKNYSERYNKFSKY